MAGGGLWGTVSLCLSVSVFENPFKPHSKRVKLEFNFIRKTTSHKLQQQYVCNSVVNILRCFHHLNCLFSVFTVKKSVKSVASHSRSYFAVAILVRHTGIQSPNNSHARTHTHTVNSEDQGPVGFSSECTVHIKQSRLQPLLSSVCSLYCRLISFKQKDWLCDIYMLYSPCHL